MKKYFVIVLLFSATCICGQSGNLDSLLKKLEFAKEDTSKVNLLYNIERKYFSIDLDSALYYNTKCEELILKIDAQEFKHRCFYEFVKIYHAKKDYKNALDYCLKSIKVAEQNKNKFHEAASYRAVFNIYHNLNMNDSAVKYAIHSIKLTTAIRDTTNIATNYGNLCWLYMDLSQYDKAMDYGLKGVEAGEQFVDTVGLLISINNLALCYIRMYKNDKAIELLKKQYEIGKRVNRQRSIRNALINLAYAYYMEGDMSGLEKSTTLLNEYNNNADIDGLNKCLQYISNAYNYIYQKKFQLAENQLLAGMKIAETDSLIDPLLTIYLTLSKVKFAQQEFLAGNYYEEKWDSLDQAEKDTKLSEYEAELKTKYETEKKDDQLKLQHAEIAKRTGFNHAISVIAIFIIIIFLLVYRTFKQKQKLQAQRIHQLEAEKLLSATEAVLKGEEQERTRLAKDLHDGLGGMLSGIKFSLNTMKENLIMTPDNAQAFERSLDMLDSSIHEMRRVAHNLMPETLLKFGLDTALKDFCSDINASGVLKLNYQSFGFENETLNESVSVSVYRIIQELVNNIVKHANAPLALVQLTKSGDLLLIDVEDDGKGFDLSELTHKKGIGWSNIYSRLEYLNGKHDIESQPGKGASIHIEIKI
jgi:signal transduction histidine kinase